MATVSVFISYCSDDEKMMKSLRRRLSDTNALNPIVVADIRKAATPLADKVKKGIEDCDYFVPILTARSITTQWVNQEIGFATALDKRVMPMVDSEISGKLKGFVHKQLDLPYTFNGKFGTATKGIRHFSTKAKILVDDILVERDIVPKDVSIESLFPGKWELRYDYKNTGQIGKDEDVEIRNSNEYFSKGRMHFFIEDLKFDAKRKKLYFTKRRPDPKLPRAMNDLRVIKLGARYKGKETSSIPSEPLSTVEYYRTDI